MILPLSIRHPACADPLDRGAEHAVATHQMPAGASVSLRGKRCGNHDGKPKTRTYAGQTIRKPMLYAYVSGGTLCRYAQRSIDTSSFSQDPPRTIRMLPDSGPRGSRLSLPP